MLKQDDIKQHLVHRHENLLLDTVILCTEQPYAGSLSLTIPENDPLGRDIFLKTTPANTRVLAAPLFMEILALGSIVVSGKLKENEAAIFAGISDFKATGQCYANECLNGTIQRISAKNQFLKYTGSLHTQNGPVCSGSMTAFFTTLDQSNTAPSSAAASAPPLLSPLQKENRYKHPLMIICDGLTALTDDYSESRYTYPLDHPLTKGHFPGNPLMMGVMLWMSVEDHLLAYLEERQVYGNQTWSCSADIVNQHNEKIADLKGLTLKSAIEPTSSLNQCEIISTKRINFRSKVKPGDTLIIRVYSLAPLT